MTDGYKIKRILVWQGGQEKQIYPAGWKPGANTIAYLPLDSTNTYNNTYGIGTTSKAGTVSFGTTGGVNCANFTSQGYITTYFSTQPSEVTAIIWCNNTNGSNTTYGGNVMYRGRTTTSDPGIYFGSSTGYFCFYGYDNNNDTYFNIKTKNAWRMLAITMSSSYGYAYLYGESTNPIKIRLKVSLPSSNFRIAIGGVDNNSRYFLGYMSNFIVESKAWTDSELLDYYNLTKSNYGL